MEHNDDVIVIDLKEIFYLLWRRLWLILLIGILGAAGLGASSKYILVPSYTSTTMVYVINRQDVERTTYSDLQMGSQLTKDYSILVKSRPVTEEVIQTIGLNLTHEELVNMINVENPDGTRILKLSVQYTDPSKAKEIADRIASVSSEQMVNIMEMEKVNILEPANLPINPSGPKVFRNTLLGGGLGVFLTMVIIVMIHLFNDRIRTSDDIEKYLGITTLGIIPMQNRRIKKNKSKEVTETNIALENY